MKKNKKNTTVPDKDPLPENNSFPKNKLFLILKIFVPVFIAIQIWLYVFHDTEKLVFQSNNTAQGIHKRTVWLVISMFLIIISFLSFFRINISNRIKNIMLLLYSTILFFLAFEILFMYAAISQGTGYAYCSKLWFNKYWERNELGYRDKTYNAATDTLKNKIVMLGDSYVAGHGTNNVADRMSDLLEKKLGSNYRVFNLGENGSTTTDEFDRLKKFPYKYDKLILVHVPNDLEYLDVNDEDTQPEETSEEGGIGAFFIKESFLVNFISYTRAGQLLQGLIGLFSGANNTEPEPIPVYPFSDTTKLNKHISNLKMIDKELKEHNIKLLIVSFPFPGNEDKLAEKYYNNFVQQLKINSFNYLDANTIGKQLGRRQQIVSSLDGHPSVKLQKLVTDSIYKRLQADSWIK